MVQKAVVGHRRIARGLAAEAVRRIADHRVVPEVGTAVAAAGLVEADRQGKTEELPVEKQC